MSSFRIVVVVFTLVSALGVYEVSCSPVSTAPVLALYVDPRHPHEKSLRKVTSIPENRIPVLNPKDMINAPLFIAQELPNNDVILKRYPQHSGLQLEYGQPRPFMAYRPTQLRHPFHGKPLPQHPSWHHPYAGTGPVIPPEQDVPSASLIKPSESITHPPNSQEDSGEDMSEENGNTETIKTNERPKSVDVLIPFKDNHGQTIFAQVALAVPESPKPEKNVQQPVEDVEPENSSESDSSSESESDERRRSLKATQEDKKYDSKPKPVVPVVPVVQQQQELEKAPLAMSKKELVDFVTNIFVNLVKEQGSLGNKVTAGVTEQPPVTDSTTISDIFASGIVLGKVDGEDEDGDDFDDEDDEDDEDDDNIQPSEAPVVKNKPDETNEDEEDNENDFRVETSTVPEHHERRALSTTTGKPDSKTAEKPGKQKVKGVILMTKKIPKKPTEETDPVIMTNFEDVFMTDKQILVLDRNQRKNQQFLKAIQDVMKQFSEMYEIPERVAEKESRNNASYEEVLEPEPEPDQRDPDPRKGGQLSNRINGQRFSFSNDFIN